jgi:hypothetical protein
MSQRVDVKIVRADDSIALVTNQDSANIALKTRVLNAMQSAKHISIDRHVPTPPPPQHPPGARCVYFSEVADHAIDRMAALGVGYTALFSADLNLSGPGGKFYVTDQQLGVLKRAGVIVASWCDCSATPYTAAQRMKQERGLVYAGGQAESEDQYVQATSLGATQIIGNPGDLGNSLRDAIDRSYDGTLAFIGEVMRPDPSYSAQGVNITSACFYIDRDAAQGGYLPLDAYAGMPASLRAGCSIYTGGRMQDHDWDTYAAWTKP